MKFLGHMKKMRAASRDYGRLSEFSGDRNQVERKHGRLAGIALEDGVTGVSDGGVDREDAATEF